MLVPNLCGGLGNNLFQIFSVYGLSNKYGHDFRIKDIPLPPIKHSKIDYKERIFKRLNNYVEKDVNIDFIINSKENPLNEYQIGLIEDNLDKNIMIDGYLQVCEYFEGYRREILDLLEFEEEVIGRYEDINEAYFMHIRLGDYVNNSFHYINLEDYYKRCIEEIGKPSICYLFSNQIELCMDKEFIKDIRVREIEEDEINSLYIMSKCGKGGIGGNSTFSWWGLYLNNEREYLYFPEKFYPHNLIYEGGYNFEGLKRVKI